MQNPCLVSNTKKNLLCFLVFRYFKLYKFFHKFSFYCVRLLWLIDYMKKNLSLSLSLFLSLSLSPISVVSFQFLPRTQDRKIMIAWTLSMFYGLYTRGTGWPLPGAAAFNQGQTVLGLRNRTSLTFSPEWLPPLNSHKMYFRFLCQWRLSLFHSLSLSLSLSALHGNKEKCI